jgi:hypothetical protein
MIEKAVSRKLKNSFERSNFSSSMAVLRIGDVRVEVVQKKIKNMRLSVNLLTGRVKIAAPHRLRLEVIQAFVTSKFQWIKKQLAKPMVQYQTLPDERSDARDRAQLLESVPALIEKWENVLDVRVKEFRIRKMKTRWGTCSIQARRIWLNLELAKRSSACLEYVVVHEMAHLIEKGHGPRFKAIMDRHLPNWRLLKRELNLRPIAI